MFQQQYFAEYPRGINPVQLNDVIFSLHATAACIVTGLQCLIYDVSIFNFLLDSDLALSNRWIIDTHYLSCTQL